MLSQVSSLLWASPTPLLSAFHFGCPYRKALRLPSLTVEASQVYSNTICKRAASLYPGSLMKCTLPLTSSMTLDFTESERLINCNDITRLNIRSLALRPVYCSRELHPTGSPQYGVPFTSGQMANYPDWIFTNRHWSTSWRT